MFIIQKKDFDQISENYIEAIQAIKKIQEGLANDDVSVLKTNCYICNKKDHLSLKCPKYARWRGNLMRMFVRLQSRQKPKFNL